MKTTWTLGIAAISMLIAGGLTQVACSSSSSDNGGGDAGGSSDGSAKHDGSSTGDSGAGDAGTGGETSVGNGPCATECAQTACANPPKDPMTGDACDTCLGNAVKKGAACNAPVLSACQGDPDCVKLLTCWNGTQAAPGGCPADGGTAGDAPDGSTDMQCQTYNEQSCLNCCTGNHQTGVNTLDNAIIACICGQ